MACSALFLDRDAMYTLAFLRRSSYKLVVSDCADEKVRQTNKYCLFPDASVAACIVRQVRHG